MLKPGRELDLLVAEHVMGWTQVIQEAPFDPYWNNPDDNQHYCFVPKYSTDISAAWEIVEKMKEKNYMLNLFSNVIQGHLVSFDHPIGTSTVWKGSFEVANWTQSAPHAICLAALKCKGVEV